MKTYLVAALAILSASTLFALPKEATVVAGEAGVHSGHDGHLQITTSHKAIINWKDFSIGSGEHVQFVQPSATSAVLNRVKGGEASSILGQLHANGKVYVINPSGIIFGKDAIIKTADFLSSTHNLSDEQFLLGKEMLFTGDSGEAIINYGTIAAQDGHITLIGRFVENQGSLSAPNGVVSIGAAQEILLKLENTPILTIRPSLIPNGKITQAGLIEALIVDLQAEGDAISHGINVQGAILALNTVKQKGKIYLKSDGIAVAPSGTLESMGGTIALETSSKGLYMEGYITAQEGLILVEGSGSNESFFNLGRFDVSGSESGGSIRMNVGQWINSGQLSANGLTTGGHIDIKARSFVETASGSLSADGHEKGGSIHLQSAITFFTSGALSCQGIHGGEIFILSPNVTLVSADLNVSGQIQGGQILVGGGPHGEELKAPNALLTRLGGDTHISASAKGAGNGGNIVIWSDEKTICYGSVEANGGSNGGDGGWIEVSGKQDLCCNATLCANAPQGKPGTILLDPKSILVSLSGIYPQYEFIDPSPASGSGFGDTTLALSSGNVVITKPGYNTNVGAVYLYNGLTGGLASALTGSSSLDNVGSEGVIQLTGNGNFIVVSTEWNGSQGAATWGSGVTGVNGVVGGGNSIIGTDPLDLVGNGGVTPLTNGNFVVVSSSWSGGGLFRTGATTWGDGTTGQSVTGFGAVSSSNSLTGSNVNDLVGTHGAVALTNGNYVILSPVHNGLMARTGAVTWGNGKNGQFTTGGYGAVSASNSLVGVTSFDQVGQNSVALTNGNYVVLSPLFNSGVSNGGATTWGNGTTGATVGSVSFSNSFVGDVANSNVGEGATALTNGNFVIVSFNWNANRGAVTCGNGANGQFAVGGGSGVVSIANSLVGSAPNDFVGQSFFGSNGAQALGNGNYVVLSSVWQNGATTGAGAVTFGNGMNGVSGPISASNSLVGTNMNDRVGSSGITELINHNYVVRSDQWNSRVGAATWGSGMTGVSGTIDSSNSLTGSNPDDFIGISVIALTNGHYVTASSFWKNGSSSSAGAATWGNGTSGTVGIVTPSNSLVGSNPNDGVGTMATALTNGNYVVLSPFWQNGVIGAAGAATWGNGLGGTVGLVTPNNSLVGSTTNDSVGFTATPLTNGNYVVNSQNWQSSPGIIVGAATWANGMGGTTGSVAPFNSLVGSQSGDRVSFASSLALSDGNYVVISPAWNNGSQVNAGAATFGNGTNGVKGPVSLQNSLVGIGSFTALHGVIEDTVNGIFIANFTAAGTLASGQVLAGLQNPNQLTYARAQGDTLVILPSFLTDTLNTGSSVTLQASSNLQIDDPISTSGASALTLLAGKSVLINADIITSGGAVTIVANQGDVLDVDRDPGNALLAIASGLTIDTGAANLTLTLSNGAGNTNTESGDLTFGDNVTLLCNGSGTLHVIATDHNIVFGENVSVTTVDGLLQLTAGVDIIATGALVLQTTGTGELILLSDNLFPISPQFGNGGVKIAGATLTTGGGKLLVYASQKKNTTLPAKINGVPVVSRSSCVNSLTEKCNTYYPNSSGIPFTVFYKQPMIPIRGFYDMIIAVVEPFQKWQNPWNNDLFFAVDRYPPFLTQKALRLRLPSLMDEESAMDEEFVLSKKHKKTRIKSRSPWEK